MEITTHCFDKEKPYYIPFVNPIAYSVTNPLIPPGQPPCMLRVGQSVANPKLTIFPNPTNSLLNLQFENLQTLPSSICVMNMLGIKVLCAENIQLSADNKMNLDLSTLPEGMYLLQVVYENGTTLSQKVVVQRGVIAN